MNPNRFIFKNNGDNEFNDVVYSGSPFQLVNYSYNFSILPKTKFWRFGIRLSKTENIEFFHPENRYKVPDFNNYIDIHIGAGEKNLDKWILPNRLSVSQYNLNGIDSVLDRSDSYAQFTSIDFSVQYDNSEQNLHISRLAQGCEPYIFKYRLGSEFKFFKIFAWADNIDFEIDCRIDVFSREKLNENDISSFEVGNIAFRHGDVFDYEAINKSNLVVLPASTAGTIAISNEINLIDWGISRPPIHEAGEIFLIANRITKNLTPKFCYAYSVDDMRSDSHIVTKICRNLTERANDLDLTSGLRINLPLLGTGSGFLSPAAVAEIYDYEFNKPTNNNLFLVNIKHRKTFNLIFQHFVGRYTLTPSNIENVKEIIRNNQINKEKTLDIGNCGITNLLDIPELFNCSHIETLILSNEWAEFVDGNLMAFNSVNKGKPNVLNSIPKEITKIKNLKKLILGGNWNNNNSNMPQWGIEDVSNLFDLENLEILNLSNNKVKNVNQINNLKKLKKIFLNNNFISSMPVLSSMALEEIYLSNNKIRNVSFLKNLKYINTIDLHSNEIKDITPLIPLIEKLDIENTSWKYGIINIFNNPLEVINTNIVDQGKINLLAYNEQLKSEKRLKLKPFINTDIKLILVGNSNVGKSTLSHWLRFNKFKAKTPSTNWLEFDEWKPIGKKVKVRIFDFGGQEYYHDTHHLFFTNRSIYLTLWDESSNYFGVKDIEQVQKDNKNKIVSTQLFPLSYWLDSIEYHTRRKNIFDTEKIINEILNKRDVKIYDAVREAIDITKPINESSESIGKILEKPANVIVVQNKVDLIDNKYFLNERDLKLKYPAINDFCAMSIKKSKGLEHFSEILYEAIESSPIIGQKFLGSWGEIKRNIENNLKLFKDEMTITSFKEKCNIILKKWEELKKFNESEIEGILFDETDTKSLAQYLNDIGLILYFPESTIDGLKDKVFLDQKVVLKKIYNVLFELENENGELDKRSIDRILKGIDERERENTINLMRQFKIIFNHPSKKNTYIAPLYLPKKPLNAIQLFLDLFNTPNIRYEYSGFIHKSIILDFFQEYGKDVYIDSKNDNLYYYWKEGIILKDKQTEEIVLVRFFDGEDNGCAHIDIYKLKDTSSSNFYDKIISTFDNINSNHAYKKSVTLDGINFVPLDIIYANEDEENWKFYFEGSYYSLIDFRKYLKKDLKMKKVFISYSKQDLAYLKQLESHLSLLRRNGKISTWTCQELLPGDKWDGKIKQELEEADIILFLVSSDFLATDYIWDIEIKRAIERDDNVNDNVSVVPIIVRHCDWEDSPLGVYNTAPKKAHVINSDLNIDFAWTSVVKELKRII